MLFARCAAAKAILPVVLQKPCLWYDKNFLASGAAKALLPVVRQKPSCLWCGKSLLACGAACGTNLLS